MHGQAAAVVTNARAFEQRPRSRDFDARALGEDRVEMGGDQDHGAARVTWTLTEDVPLAVDSNVAQA